MLYFRSLCALGLFACLAVTPVLAADPPPVASESVLHWIWNRDTALEFGIPPREKTRLERVFQTDEPIQTATVRIAADYCGAAVEINGRPVLTLEPFSPTTEVEVTSALRRGENRIAVAAASIDGPPAIALSLTLVAASGKRHTIVSDESWKIQPLKVR